MADTKVISAFQQSAIDEYKDMKVKLSTLQSFVNDYDEDKIKPVEERTMDPVSTTQYGYIQAQMGGMRYYLNMLELRLRDWDLFEEADDTLTPSS